MAANARDAFVALPAAILSRDHGWGYPLHSRSLPVLPVLLSPAAFHPLDSAARDASAGLAAGGDGGDGGCVALDLTWSIFWRLFQRCSNLWWKTFLKTLLRFQKGMDKMNKTTMMITGTRVFISLDSKPERQKTTETPPCTIPGNHGAAAAPPATADGCCNTPGTDRQTVAAANTPAAAAAAAAAAAVAVADDVAALADRD